jgi:hypothetical protein
MILDRLGRGSRFLAPLMTRRQNVGQNVETVDTIFRGCPSEIFEDMDDFAGSLRTYTLGGPLFESGELNIVPTTDTVVVRTYFVAPRTGYLVAANFVGEDTLTAHDTNYVTFAVTNRILGSGSTAMLAATDANTTKATGGSTWTAKTARSATVHGTAANLRVNAGDVIEVTITVAGTLANVVDCPRVELRFATVPDLWTPRIARTAGVVHVAPVADTIGGEVVCQLGATDEAQVAGIDFGDRLCLRGDKLPWFEARFKISAVAASTRYVVGLASAYNATFDSVAKHLWFRIEGNSLSLLVETDDATTDNDDQDTGIDLVADTYVKVAGVFLDGGRVAFSVNDQEVKILTCSASAMGSSLLQPVAYNQKDTAAGTEEHALTLDYFRYGCNRR